MIERVLLVPGLFEPRSAMWPLRWWLRRHCRHVDIWRDRYVFRSLEQSVSRLAETIAGSERSIALVTHSFGDWVARAAIAAAGQHRVDALVSVAPVIVSGPLPATGHLLTGDFVPELKVMMDRQQAAANLQPDHSLRRLVIWARVDHFVRPLPAEELAGARVIYVSATHVTAIMQPGVLRTIDRFLFASRADEPEPKS